MAEALDSIYNDETEATILNNIKNNDHGWQTVTNPKRQRKNAKKTADLDHANVNSGAVLSGGDKVNVFRSIEAQSEDRRRRFVEAKKSALTDVDYDDDDDEDRTGVRSKHRRSDEDFDGEDVSSDENSKGTVEVKKVKAKKVKKPKVTVAEAAARIDSADLAAFLADVTASYETQQDIQMMRFADYFGRAFSGVSGSQFPWTKMFRESTIEKIVDIPLVNISEAVYRTSVDWINNRSSDALGSFVLWSLDSILTELASHQSVVKGSKKGVQQVPPSKSQVAIFIVLAMVLRRKPDVLISVLPTLRENHKYQGQDKLPVIVWMMAQASHSDLAVGLYSWAHNLLPIVSGKSSCNPQSRDLVLQLVERILSMPKARTILVNGAVRKGERLVPPSSLELLMRVTFPASSARIKATERFEAIYPTLKDVALAGVTGSKAMKQVSLQIFSFAIEAAGEEIPALSKEASGIFIWCLTQNADCYKHWDKVYEDKLGGSVAILRKLNEDCKKPSLEKYSLNQLQITLKCLRLKNEKALVSEEDPKQKTLLKEADKLCKVILGRVSRGHGCLKLSIAVIAIAVGGAAILSSPNMDNWDWNKLSETLSSQRGLVLETLSSHFENLSSQFTSQFQTFSSQLSS